VTYGTPILTPTGYRPVQQLKSGDLVEEYNFSTNQLMIGTFLSGNVTTSNSVIEVNDGLLRLTATDQPIFITNATFTGWLRDPQNLTTSDSLFDSVSGEWIQVTSVEFEWYHVRVYDVSTNGANNFVANGVLLDQKKP